MKRTQQLLAVAAGVVLAAGGLTACRGTANDFSTGRGSTQLVIEGDVGNPNLVADFNPYHPQTRLGGVYVMYEPLEVPSSVNGSYIPFLATQFTTPTATTAVFTLRPGVKWQDGQAFTADDVLFTFDLLKKYPALDNTGAWSALAGVTSSGNTVTFTFTQPNVPFVSVVAAVPIVPQHVWSTVGDPSKYDAAKPVGTGPFQLDTFSPTGYVLKKFSGYWNATQIAPATVSYPAQSTNQSTNQLETSNGKYDWSYQFLPNVQQTYVSRSQYNKYWFPPGGAISLYMNLTKAPYNDVNYRKGISFALNRDTIAQKAVNGYLPGASQSGLILPNLNRWLDPSLPNKGYITQDKSKAMQYFQQAGYTLQNNVLVSSSGQPAAMAIVAPGQYSDWVAACKEIVTELGEVGLKVTLDLPQPAQYTSEIQSGNFDAAFGGFGGTGIPYNDYNNALNSSFATPINTPTVNNYERFKSSEVDQALAKLAAATDFDTQASATHVLEQVVYDQVPVVVLYYGGSWGLFSQRNFTGWPSASDPYTLPTPYNNAVLVVVSRLKRAAV